MLVSEASKEECQKCQKRNALAKKGIQSSWTAKRGTEKTEYCITHFLTFSLLIDKNQYPFLHISVAVIEQDITKTKLSFVAVLRCGEGIQKKRMQRKKGGRIIETLHTCHLGPICWQGRDCVLRFREEWYEYDREIKE